MLKLPNYEVKMQINEYLLKSLVQSKSSYDRQVFLDIAYLAADEFSSDYFNKNFSHLLFLFSKDKSMQVALVYSKYVVKFQEAIGNSSQDYFLGSGFCAH